MFTWLWTNIIPPPSYVGEITGIICIISIIQWTFGSRRCKSMLPLCGFSIWNFQEMIHISATKLRGSVGSLKFAHSWNCNARSSQTIKDILPSKTVKSLSAVLHYLLILYSAWVCYKFMYRQNKQLLKSLKTVNIQYLSIWSTHLGYIICIHKRQKNNQ